jgi:hypothetical protein
MFSVIVRLHFASMTLLEQNASAMELLARAAAVCGIDARSTPRCFRCGELSSAVFLPQTDGSFSAPPAQHSARPRLTGVRSNIKETDNGWL